MELENNKEEQLFTRSELKTAYSTLDFTLCLLFSNVFLVFLP
jgi:hypothetical protein